MFYDGAIKLGKYDGDFQCKMLFSIRVRGDTRGENVKILIKW